MGCGDEIIAAGMAQKMFERDSSRRIGIFDRYQRPRWHEMWDGNPIIAKPADITRRKEPIQRLTNASGCRPYIVYPFTAQTGWKFNTKFRARDYIAKLYLTTHERRRGASARERYGPYVLVEPWTKHVNFKWPMDRWAQVIEACPDLTFVQHTHQFSRRPLPRAHIEPPSTFRETCGLVNSALAYARSESGLCHAAAALGCPTVTLWGGCMDSEVLGGYPLQISLADREKGSPCGKWEPCKHCAEAMRRITVDMVVSAIRASVRRRSEAAA